MRGHVLWLGPDRADECEPDCLLGPQCGYGPGQVSAVGVAKEKERFIPEDVVDEAKQQVQDIIVGSRWALGAVLDFPAWRRGSKEDAWLVTLTSRPRSTAS